MFDIAWSELLIIAVVALVVVGPKDLPKVLRVAGQWMGKVRRMAGEFQAQVNEAIREAELDDVKKTVEDLKSYNPATILKNEIENVTSPLTAAGKGVEDEFASIKQGLESQPGAAEPAAPMASSATAEAAGPAAAEPATVFEADPLELERLRVSRDPGSPHVPGAVPYTMPEPALHEPPAALAGTPPEFAPAEPVPSAGEPLRLDAANAPEPEPVPRRETARS
jgi:sec-independent protein translocase protein TatB